MPAKASDSHESPADRIAALVRAGRSSWMVLPFLLCLSTLAVGCQNAGSQISSLPARHSVRSEQLLVLSDFRLDPEHPLIQDLMLLREQVAQTLDLPIASREVVVYLFSDEAQYRRFLTTRYPDLPPRRAYFIGTAHELAVYTFWGERVQEDLRHEFTHGILHASLRSVPLWLDEGLAEFFELDRSIAGGLHMDYVSNLVSAAQNGWEPDLERLERLELVHEMTRSDYQEAWAWVHLMVNDGQLRPTLFEYLAELRDNPHPIPLSERLRLADASLNARFCTHVASLTPR